MTFTEVASVGYKPSDLAIKPRLLPVLRVFRHTKTLQYDNKNKSRITPDKLCSALKLVSEILTITDSVQRGEHIWNKLQFITGKKANMLENSQ